MMAKASDLPQLALFYSSEWQASVAKHICRGGKQA
jgi:hypothetical protein